MVALPNAIGGAALKVLTHSVIANARTRGAPAACALGCGAPAGDDVRHYFGRSLRPLGRSLWAGREEWPATGDHAGAILELHPSQAPPLGGGPFLFAVPLGRNAALDGRQPTKGASVMWARLCTLGRPYTDCGARHDLLVPLRLRRALWNMCACGARARLLSFSSVSMGFGRVWRRYQRILVVCCCGCVGGEQEVCFWSRPIRGLHGPRPSTLRSCV